MYRQHLRFALSHVLVWAGLVACSATHPSRPDDGGASPDGSGDGAQPGPNGAHCIPRQPLRCDGTSLVRCNDDGTATVHESCALACVAAELRCADVAPSNGLAAFLDATSNQPDYDFGESATIHTDTGAVRVDGADVPVKTELLPQPGAPSIRVLIVGSLTTKRVVVEGSQALAVVSNGGIVIRGAFAASAERQTPGPGAMNDGDCRGKNTRNDGRQITGGAGGGGFGSVGGAGGDARNNTGTIDGGMGGSVTGNESLIPLRGGCDGGTWALPGYGYGSGVGGGAIQLVSRTHIAVNGVLAANGSSYYQGGGSGGGILLEAPTVEVGGGVVANGGAGAGCDPGYDGLWSGAGAPGGHGCSQLTTMSDGGNGGARDAIAQPGMLAQGGRDKNLVGGGGGGGVGRIRVNTVPGGLRSPGLFSPPPSQGIIAHR